MNRLSVVIAVIMFLPFASLQSAVKRQVVKNRLSVIQDGIKHYEYQKQNYHFRVEIISDREGVKSERLYSGEPFVTARPDERYAVRLHNPLPVRVAVNLSVDGLNSITGKPSGIKKGRKWIIPPHSFITIRGWQINDGELRRFFFTDKPKSYAKWRSEELGKNLSVNCGVIGAAYFWSRKELRQYFDGHPIYRYSSPKPYGKNEMPQDKLGAGRASAPMFKQDGVNDPSESSIDREQQAGTGMGERESHHTRLVDFRYDTGMYKISEAVVIYYDFAQPEQPNPFPNLSFAPEMPYRT